ncbi:cytidine and deoxycytidylate deaminase zinc-binding region protein [Aphelenchoides avenae]|nr:cytidine and deoxycytidylate deaminase zinc-binding region protein [Aphelenchus avenae]
MAAWLTTSYAPGYGWSSYGTMYSTEWCAAAIRWAGFREYIYGTSINKLIEQGWGQMRISSQTIFEQSYDLPTQTRLIAKVLTNETDPYFAWQFNPKHECPAGCKRPGPGESCTKT